MTSEKRPIIQNDHIDFIVLAKTIWADRKLFLIVTSFFVVMGIFIAFGSKVEYVASCKLMPESQESIKTNFGGLGSLAGFAGINLNSGRDGALTPDIYPQIAQSIPFQMKIWNETIHFELMDTVSSSYNYFKEIDKPSILNLLTKYTVGIPSQIKSWLFSSENSSNKSGIIYNDNIIRLSKADTKLLGGFKERISVFVDTESGIISLSAKMPDPLAAAELTQHGIDLLTEYVTAYKVKKAKENLDFINARYIEVKTEFEKSQQNLAIFNDRNRNVVTAVAQTELQRLKNEYDVNFEVYKSLATQLEQAKIKVKEETLVFTILEPVKVPVEKSSPKRKLVVVISLFLGGFLGLGSIFIKIIWSNLVTAWQK